MTSQRHKTVARRSPGIKNRSIPPKGKPKRKSSGEPSTPSTASTELAAADVEVVEGVEGHPRKPLVDWLKDRPLDNNFSMVGRALVKQVPQLYRLAEGGLLLVEAGRPRRIKTAKELSPLLIDSLILRVWTEPDAKGNRKQVERLNQTVLGDMLGSRSFLENFPLVEDIVTSPVVLADGTPSDPAFNPGGVLYLGPAVQVRPGISAITRFLEVMEFDGNASRTNAVAAALTVLWRHYWHGGKPLVLVTASKSHSGKGTLFEFIRGNCAKAEMQYQGEQWALAIELAKQLSERPEIGVVTFDNVRLLTRGGRIIKSQLFESFITSSETTLATTKLASTFRSLNKYVVLLNTNEGVLSADLLNRSLPIHLKPTGDLEERIARAKARLGGDVKTEWLPAHRQEIEAELWGMIEKWRQEGKPLDETVKYPMSPWAKTIGGILMVNGFTDFLGNYSTTRGAADPIREAIRILAFYAAYEAKHRGKKALPTEDLAKLVVSKGLNKDLISGVDPSNVPACTRALGVTLTPYDGEDFTATTASEKITYRLKKKEDRWEGPKSSPQRRYSFEEIKREAVAKDDLGGLVLEEPSTPSNGFLVPLDDLGKFQPEQLQ